MSDRSWPKRKKKLLDEDRKTKNATNRAPHEQVSYTHTHTHTHVLTHAHTHSKTTNLSDDDVFVAEGNTNQITFSEAHVPTPVYPKSSHHPTDRPNNKASDRASAEVTDKKHHSTIEKGFVNSQIPKKQHHPTTHFLPEGKTDRNFDPIKTIWMSARTT